MQSVQVFLSTSSKRWASDRHALRVVGKSFGRILNRTQLWIMKCVFSCTSDMDVQQEDETCALQFTSECFLMQHSTNAQRACAQTFPPPFIAAPLTSILGTDADVHRVSCWLLHFGDTAPASGCWPRCILFLFIFMDVSDDTRCLAGTGRWPGDGRREEGSWTGENSPLICRNRKNPPKANSNHDRSNH